MYKPVITSYSIHYTKLYDAAGALAAVPATGRRRQAATLPAGRLGGIGGTLKFLVVVKGEVVVCR